MLEKQKYKKLPNTVKLLFSTRERDIWLAISHVCIVNQVSKYIDFINPSFDLGNALQHLQFFSLIPTYFHHNAGFKFNMRIILLYFVHDNWRKGSLLSEKCRIKFLPYFKNWYSNTIWSGVWNLLDVSFSITWIILLFYFV